MLASLFSLVTAFLVLVSVIFLVYRFNFFATERVSGRYAFLFGGSLLFFAAVWDVARYLTEYADWFVEGAYPILDVVHLIIFVAGVLLAVVGLALYADFWQTRREELTTRDRQLSILNNLQADAREPYQTVELLDISIKEIISQVPETAGAIFMINRSQRQLILTGSVGFTKQETAFLERYPYGRNVVSQSIETMEPVISGTFEFVDNTGKTILSKFNSCLVLPLVAGTEKIGAMILVSPNNRYFGRAEIRYMSPVADWLAVMIRSSRLSKELTFARRDIEEITSQHADFTRRILTAADSFSKADGLTSFCGSLVGLVGGQSVHLLGMKNGALNIYGGSEPMLDLSENYKTALIDALDRRKPLIINQEATTDDGRTYIARSTLLYPLTVDNELTALLFLKDGSPFRVSEDDLKVIDVYGRLALLTIRQKDTSRLDITRRKGLEKVLQLLRFDPTLRFETDPGFFINHLASVLPSKSIGLTFVRQPEGSFKAVDGLRASAEQLASLEMLPGEGAVGTVAADFQAQYISGKAGVSRELRSYDEVNRDLLLKIFGENGLPNFMAVCPISTVNEVAGVIVLLMFDVSENEKSEWQRLLTLASGLFSLRLTINSLHTGEPVADIETADALLVGEAINKLNNHLSAIVGNAGLAEVRSDLSGEVRNHFKSIVLEAEQASSFLKSSLGKYSAEVSSAQSQQAPRETVNDVIDDVLSKTRISDNLYMLGGRAREMSYTLSEVNEVEFESESIRNLFEEAINRFATLAEDEDVITVATYVRADYVYLDISRHHRNFPPVQSVAGFGHYQNSAEVLNYRPADTFLKHISEGTCFYSYDRVAPDPSYLSFKFPVKGRDGDVWAKKGKPKILAIDDQAVILDLISAMCQTTGYEVQTASSGEEGLQLALSGKYDIILTDLAMPGLSGIEIAHEVRKKKPDIPIVLVTGWEMNISKEKMEAAGITKVLYKPFRIEQLTDIIGTLLESRSRA